MDIRAYNRRAWDREVEKGNRWTVPVSTEMVTAARHGQWEIFLTPSRPVPREWFPEISGCDVLCLASGGGQQGPILAAAGANVTVLDNSPRQLAQDRTVAEREGLDLCTVEGDMADLSSFGDESFDLIVHPVSNSFAPVIRPVWQEALRVLRRGGSLLAGFTNPAAYVFDWDLADRTGVLKVRYALPYAGITDLPEDVRAKGMREGEPLEFSHTLEDQIGGQLDAGFVITNLFEDRNRPEDRDALDAFMPAHIATRALKP
jgi:SAM-dependent methyltransferase